MESMLNKLKSTVTKVTADVTSAVMGNPVTREFEVGRHIASGGPGMCWRIYNGTKKSTKQVCVLSFLWSAVDCSHQQSMWDVNFNTCSLVIVFPSAGSGCVRVWQEDDWQVSEIWEGPNHWFAEERRAAADQTASPPSPHRAASSGGVTVNNAHTHRHKQKTVSRTNAPSGSSEGGLTLEVNSVQKNLFCECVSRNWSWSEDSVDGSLNNLFTPEG